MTHEVDPSIELARARNEETALRARFGELGFFQRFRQAAQFKRELETLKTRIAALVIKLSTAKAQRDKGDGRW